ncbi:hypothetical protein [Oenococcus sp.]|uniref:hypothetical protein n=1 Tax=Oenococcus sp. TaxID=1979414 RepID=UPI0039EA1EC0
MTELSRLASVLLNKQEKDGIPANTAFKDGLIFSEKHGYGDLARQVIKEWDDLPLGEGESQRPTRHQSSSVRALRSQCLSLRDKGHSLSEIQQQTDLTKEEISYYLRNLTQSNK